MLRGIRLTERNRLSVAVKGAAEYIIRAIAATHHGGHTDVAGQLDVLAIVCNFLILD